MNDDRIEELLRKAPGPKAPESLHERLQRGVRVPRAAETGAGQWAGPSWIRRWLPAWSFAVLLLGSLVVIGMQTSELNNLKRENESLRAAAPNLDQLRADNADYPALKAASQELDRLRKDRDELDRLRAEVAQLKTAIQEAEQLRAENQRLQAENTARLAQATAAAGSLEEAEAKARQKAERTACMNNMKQIGLSLRVWAIDNEDTFPTDYISMTNELNNFKLMQCPGDKARTVRGWPDVAAGNVSYEFLTPGIKFDKLSPATVAVRCPIHHNYLLIDGSVQALNPVGEQSLKMINGRLTLEQSQR